MSVNLANALERVFQSSRSKPNDWIDNILEKRYPGNCADQISQDLKLELEQKYLVPSLPFSTELVQDLQQRWEDPADYTSLFQIAPTQTRTITRFTREGLEGRVTGYKEVTIPTNNATAKNSTSFLRKPGSRVEFVEGSTGFYPFAPGGMDNNESVSILDEQVLSKIPPPIKSIKNKLERVIKFDSKQGLLEIAPGLSRGGDFDPSSKDPSEAKEATDLHILLEQEPNDYGADGKEQVEDNDPADPGVVGDQKGEDFQDDENENDEEDIDLLLPLEFPALQPHDILAVSSAKRAGREWAHMVDIKRDFHNFRELVPDMAREWPFNLDTFQKEAIYRLECGDSVFVAAHTSAGKTVVAEYAIALATKHMTRAIYTSPIKALSNQKFRDFREIFEEVGILTGDVQIAPEASCLIMTTEILRSMLYRGADIIRDVEFVIFDEVHYVNDSERGVVWEEVIIMLPEHVTLILLSATVPNTYEFASWVGRTKKKDIYVISTPKRPVPLEHYLWAGNNMIKIVDSEKKFLDRGWKEANEILSRREKQKIVPTSEFIQRGGRGFRGERGNSKPRGFIQPRGRAGNNRVFHTKGHMGHGGRPGGRTSAAQDKTLWVHLVQFLKKLNLLPACIFIFSKKRCEENSDALINQDFCVATEKSAIHMIIEKSVARLKPEDRTLPQIVRLRDMLSRGVAVHHGGLLPIVKEIVEILFAQSLVKVLFATETFAMGLNLPTKTVVFSGYRKHDGHTFRNLLPGEYTQMAGRAGRRGLDTVGSVIIVTPGADEAPPVVDLRHMILGQPSKLRSQFRLTYNMILNLLRVEALKIEEMIKRSFSEHATQQLLPEHERAVELSEADLDKVKRDVCSNCDIDLDMCHQAAQEFRKCTAELHKGLLSTPVGRRMLTPKKLIVFLKDGVRTPGILIKEGAASGGVGTVHILEICTKKDSRDLTDLLPYLPKFRKIFTNPPDIKKSLHTKPLQIPVTNIECVTKTILRGVIPEIFGRDEDYQKAKEQLIKLFRTWESSEWDEADWKKITDLHLRDLIAKRDEISKTAQYAACVECPDFIKHASLFEALIK